MRIYEGNLIDLLRYLKENNIIYFVRPTHIEILIEDEVLQIAA
tara:strand:- start:16789 stop:16917 length:129 start_codon:yes stop_codon:yes gene_type:complete